MTSTHPFHRREDETRPLSARAFTLLEVMVAVAVIALLAITLNRFIAANLQALGASVEASSEKLATQGLVNLLQAQLMELQPGVNNQLIGEPHKFGSLSSDRIEWLCKPGIGLLTTAAPVEDYRVSLELKPVTKTSSTLELGLRRRPVLGTEKDETWLPLMKPVAGLEIRYFHAAQNAKVDRWNDPSSLPMVVYLTITKQKDDAPIEAVLRVPAAMVQQR